MATELPEPRLPVEVTEGCTVVVRQQEAEVVFGVVDPFRLSPNRDAGAKKRRLSWSRGRDLYSFVGDERIAVDLITQFAWKLKKAAGLVLLGPSE